MVQPRQMRKKSIIYTWLVSYVIILIVPLLMGSILYMVAKVSIENEVNHSNDFLLEQTKQNVDQLLDEVRRLNAEISFNKRLELLMDTKKPINREELYELHKFNDDLKLYQTSNRPVDGFYVYLNNLDTVVDGNAVTDSSSFYRVLDISDSIDVWKWRESILGEKSARYIRTQRRHENGELIDVIAHVQPLPISSALEKNTTSVIILDEERVLKTVEGQIETEGAFFILNQGDILASRFTSEKYSEINFSQLSSAKGRIQAEIKGEKMSVSYTTSEITGWQYAFVIPSSIIWEKSQNIMNVAIIMLLISVLSVALLVRFFLKKNYRPIGNLVHNIEQNIGLLSDEKSSELAFIEQTIEKTLRKNKEINTYLEQQKVTLRQSFLTKFLKGRMDSTDNIDEYFKSFEISFESQSFVVMLIYIDDLGNFFPEEKDLSENDKFMHAQFIISNVIKELIEEFYSVYLTEIDDMLAAIINIAELQKVKEHLDKIIEQAQQFIEKHFNLPFTVSVSNCHQTEMGIPAAYQEAVAAMEYKFIMPEKKNIYFDSIDNHSQKTYYYPIEQEYQLINNIKAGSFQKVKEILNDIFEVNFRDKFISIQVAKCLIFDLVSTMIKTIHEIGGQEGKEYIEEILPIDMLLSCATIEDMMENMFHILEDICNYVKSKQEGSLKNKVHEFVLQNYADESLSVNSVADHLKMHPSYVSAAFKEQSGEGLLDFIGQIRTEKAKIFLSDTDSDMEVVAKSVGYGNVRTFTRVFRKHAGITPTKFKEIVDNSM